MRVQANAVSFQPEAGRVLHWMRVVPLVTGEQLATLLQPFQLMPPLLDVFC